MGAFSAETEAFLRQAMERHSAMVYRLAYARTRNAADAQDVYQEAFLRLALCKREFADDEHVKAWLIRTTAHLSVNVVASAWRRRVTLVEYLPRERESAPEEPSFVLHALRQLPPGDRTVLHLYYFEGMRAEEMARVLGKSASGVRMRLTRARPQSPPGSSACFPSGRVDMRETRNCSRHWNRCWRR